ncbi:MAG: YihY/virulence factor BrkB family protein [Atribacterota bacterium]
MYKKIIEKIIKIKLFIFRDIWLINLSYKDGIKSFFIKVLKTFLIVVNDFFKDKCLLRASSLTYHFFLALVPFFAVAFATLKGFGFQNTYGVIFLENILLNKEVARQVVAYITNTNLEALGIFGAFALIFVSIFLLANIERSFNEIWGVKEKRSIFKKGVYYLFAVIVFPLFITLVLSAVSVALGDISLEKSKVLSYPASWIALTLAYLFFTNEKVKIGSAFLGGFIAGTLWHLAQGGYILWSQSIQNFNIIYGSFTQVVLVFIWIYINWIIVLIGAEVAFAVQNVNNYQKTSKAENISFSFKEKLTLIILYLVYSRFKKGDPPLSAEEIIKETKGPIKLINQILFEMTEMGILIENKDEDRRIFTPAMSEEKITLPYILNKVRKYGLEEVPIKDNKSFKKIDKLINKMFSDMEEKYRDYKITGI